MTTAPTLFSCSTTMADPMRAQLHAGDTLRIRYAGTKPSSTQGRAWRTVHILVGPHEDYDYTHGPVVTVKDLTDPAGERTKTLYIHRIVDAEGLDIDSGTTHQAM